MGLWYVIAVKTCYNHHAAGYADDGDANEHDCRGGGGGGSGGGGGDDNGDLSGLPLLLRCRTLVMGVPSATFGRLSG